MTRLSLVVAALTLGFTAPLAAQEAPSAALPARVDLSPDTLRLTVGETAQIELEAFDAAGQPIRAANIAWFAGWENARIDSLGSLTAINAGTTAAGALLVGSADSAGNPISGQVMVLIEPADPADLRIALPETPLPAGSFVRVEPIAVDAQGNELWDRTVTLESSDPAIVEAIGHTLDLRSPGRAALRARVGGTVREFPIDVAPPVTGELALRAVKTHVETGEAVRLTLTAGGREVARPQWWVSSQGATVDTDNTFVAEKPGTYTIAAMLGERSARTTIEVALRDLPGGWVKVGRASAPVREIDLWVFEARDGRDYAYTGSYGAQMRVYDVTDPASPVFTDSVPVPGRRVNDVMVSDDATFAVITQENDPDRHNGIIVLDLADPAHPVIASHYWEDLTAGIHTTWIEGELVYAVNDGTRDVHIIDVGDIRHPRQVGRWGLDTERKALHDLMIVDGLAYLAYWDDGLVILDVGAGIAGGTPTEPTFVSRINYPAGNTHTAWRWKDYVFVGDEIFPNRYSPDAPSDPRGFIHVIDVGDIFHPREVAKYEVPEGGAHNVWVEEDVLYVAYYQRGLRAIDLSGGVLVGDLYKQGREIDYFLTETSDPEKVPDPTLVNRTNVYTVVVHKGHVYAIDGSSGLWIMKLERPEEVARR